MIAPSPAPFAVWRDTLAAVALVGAVPLAALAALAWDARVVRRWAPHAAAVAAGALLGAALFQLLPEARARGASGVTPALALAAGAAIFYALERALHGTHDHHHGAHTPNVAADGAPRHGSLVALAVAGDALHNFVDGALVAATFLADVRAGVLTTAAVALHEVPREFGTFGAIVHGGVPPRRALAYNAATALAAGAGAAVTLTFGARAAALAPVVLPFAAGNFLYLAGALVRSLASEPRASGGNGARAAWARRLALMLLGVLATGLPALV
ncbi:MAG TPA: ZIP family metal transporter [Gemmatirosa sp.]